MNQDSRSLPETEIFCLQDAVFIVHTPDPDRPPPPKPTCSAEGARALMTLRPLVERVLRTWNVPQADVPDVTQKVMLAVLDWWSARGPTPTAADLHVAEAYLAVVARHAAHDHHRRRRPSENASPDDPRHRLLHGAEPRETPTAPSPEDLALAEEARAELASELHLDALATATTPAAWRAFYAYTLLDVRIDVIAESERVPPATIYNRLRLAREDLRTFLRRARAARRPR